MKVLAVPDESPVTQMSARRHHVSAAVVIVSLPRQVPQDRKVRQRVIEGATEQPQ